MYFLLKIMNVCISHPKIFLSFPKFAVVTAVDNPCVVETLFGNCLNTFFINGKPILANGKSKGPTSFPRNPPDYMFLDIGVLGNLILPDELYAKALQSLENGLSLNKNVRGKLVLQSELPIKFEVKFKVTSVTFFFLEFNLSSCELDSNIFKLLY